MDVTVLIHPKCKNLTAVEAAVAVTNQLQADFVLHLEPHDWLPNGVKEITPNNVTRLIRKIVWWSGLWPWSVRPSKATVLTIPHGG